MQKSKLKRRLRKKFHLGEFQEFGFEILIKFRKETDEAQFDRFWREFISEIESQGLICGGGGDYKIWQVFVTSEIKFDSPTNEKKEKLQMRLDKYAAIENFKIGELKDAWNNLG